jgi:hypothetical protein
VVEAARRAISEQTDRSTGTVGRLRRRVEQLLAEDPDPPPMPPERTFYRLVARLSAGKHTFGSARTRRSLAKQPEGPFGAVTAARPGEWTEIDSTPLDVRVVLDDGLVDRVELTGLVDQATRTLAAAVLRPTTKAVDAALLLAGALTPEAMRPSGPARQENPVRVFGQSSALLPVVEVADSARPGEVVGEQTVRVTLSTGSGGEGFVGHCSTHDQAAIGGERLAGEGFGFVAGEHGHHSGGVVGCERPVQRHVRLGIGELGRRPGGAGGGASESRRDRGHRDSVAAEPDRERPRHSDQRALRRDVGEHMTVRRAPERVRDDEDHAAEPPISHSGSERLREQQRRLYVDRLNLAPGVEFDLLERPERERRRGVNEDVAPAVTIEDKFSGAAYVICVA